MHGPVLQPFVYDEAHPYASGQHRGIDIGADAGGESVVAPAAGTISFAGTVPTNGKSVTIETSDGYSVTLTHLGAITVAKGATVAEGDAVGAIGPSGTPEVDGPYVHLGIRLTADPNGYVDPLGLLPAVTTESPPTTDDSTTSQPSASSGSAPATPATQPVPAASASATPASTPVTSTRGTTVRSSSARRAPHRAHGSAHRSRPQVQRPRSLQRPTVTVPVRASVAPALPRRAAKPQRRASEPVRDAQVPVVEAAAPRERNQLDAGQSPGPAAHVARPPQQHSQPERPAPGALLPLTCNGAAALVALAAALAAARRRRQRLTEAPVAAAVLPLPDARLRRVSRQQRRAA